MKTLLSKFVKLTEVTTLMVKLGFLVLRKVFRFEHNGHGGFKTNIFKLEAM